ncbi:hypothetical protein ACKI1L_37900, partial [Streptomyces scabiei]|uniref:hypothetical protein n=1 Tax=Streptomyces scabiei TaxID=1930 RepID=UPI0038F75466
MKTNLFFDQKRCFFGLSWYNKRTGVDYSMSYEGYEQWLCGQGHLTIYDCYESPERLNWKCPVCQSGVALVDCVDQT